MDRSGIEAAKWSNPELVDADSAKDNVEAEPENFDTSTVDPSHVIYLIRQLLPNETRGDPVPLELLQASSGIVLKSTVVDGVPSDNNLTAQDAFEAVEGGTVYDNGIIHAGQVVEGLSTKQDKATDTCGSVSVHQSATTELSNADLEIKERSEVVNLSDKNINCIGENGNHIEQNGIHIQDNREFSRPRDRVRGIEFEHNGDTAEFVEKYGRICSEKLPGTASVPIKSGMVEGQVEENILDVPEVKRITRPVANDTHRKTDGDDEAREEAGCVLWDLAASESSAKFLVEHHILDVLLAFLSLPHSDRMREICLGVLGNLACHLGPGKAMAAIDGLVETIVQQLTVENIPSLTETCRLLSAGLHSEASLTWIESIKSDTVLERIMWIAANALDSQLLEKCTELILVMVDNKRYPDLVLLPSLLRLGLPRLLTDLMECELTALSEGTSPRGDVVLDIVLQIAEAISISDDLASQLTASDQLFALSCQVICLSVTDEIGPSGITATVLIANLLTEESGLIEQVFQDAIFLGRLLALVPCAGEDPGARNALWSILGRICRRLASAMLEDPQYSPSGMVAVLADGCSLVLDDLDVHQEDDVEEEYDQAQAGHDAAASTSRGLQAKLATVVNIMHIMKQWSSAHGGCSTQDMPLLRSVRKARTLLHKHVSVSEISLGSVGTDSSSRSVQDKVLVNEQEIKTSTSKS